ncbi:hypothetical protein Bca52824_054293 [Brassica carinata]|uniref:Uncharacterized protein n=1 Tax=Brassica carinata TaxID=52824 RepID=A0A8X7R5I6_BRACI|nr:hypothetical protein Bca52824_054293 [Brassica carinata]
MFIALEVTKVETLTIGEIYVFLGQEPIQVVCPPVLPDIQRSDYLYKGTALHLAAQIAILDVAGYCFPSLYQCLNCWSLLTDNKSLVAGFDQKLKMSFNHKVIFRASDGGTTHKETLQLLMNLGTSVAQFTVEDGTTIDLIEYNSPLCFIWRRHAMLNQIMEQHGYSF